jgi:hypothetical protein
MIGEAWQVSGWEMLFFEPFFSLVEKAKILSFPYAVKIQEIESGAVYINLFDHIKESHTPDSMFRQWKWQEWIDFDSLENKYFKIFVNSDSLYLIDKERIFKQLNRFGIV